MAWDKYCAIKGRWRVPEATLFLLAMLGASPTVFFLISYLRHKSNKAAFRWRLTVILGLQMLCFSVGSLLFLF